jgi:hypothetical protein
LAITLLLAGGAYWRSFAQGHRFTNEAQVKQELNMCQVYAFNYQQRHPDRFQGNAFTECAPLMQHDFGHPMPSLFNATIANPRAIAAFIAWNGRLLGSGVQVALFGATATGDNPDYIPVKNKEFYTIALSIIALGLIACGLVVMNREREFWRREWLAEHKWAVVMFGTLVFTTLVVALTQRPRAEYMYGLTVGLMALVGLCTSALLRRFGAAAVLSALAIGLVMVLIIVMPSYYHREPRPLHDAIERLQVVRGVLQRSRSVLITAGDGLDTCYYLAKIHDRYCTSPSWPMLQTQLGSGTSIQVVFNRVKATVIYVDPVLLSNPSIASLVAAPHAAGWRQVASGAGPDGPWHVLVRTS